MTRQTRSSALTKKPWKHPRTIRALLPAGPFLSLPNDLLQTIALFQLFHPEANRCLPRLQHTRARTSDEQSLPHVCRSISGLGLNKYPEFRARYISAPPPYPSVHTNHAIEYVRPSSDRPVRCG